MAFLIAVLFAAVLIGILLAFFRAKTGRIVEVKIGETMFRAEVADTDLLRAKGLMGRTQLGEKEGMVFLFDRKGSYGFWMKGMNMSIDIIWIADGRVVGVAERLPPAEGIVPQLYYPPEPADTVLEVGAGVAERYRIETGDPVEISAP